jgi:hypothetical protein
MFVHATHLPAFTILQPRFANRHLIAIYLMQKATAVAFHAHAIEPEGTYCLQKTGGRLLVMLMEAEVVGENLSVISSIVAGLLS